MQSNSSLLEDENQVEIQKVLIEVCRNYTEEYLLMI